MYEVRLQNRAMKQLKKLPNEARQQIQRRLVLLMDNPRPDGAIKLTAIEPPTYRVRIGNYRVIYHIWDDQLIVMVVEVLHRKDAYRD